MANGKDIQPPDAVQMAELIQLLLRKEVAGLHKEEETAAKILQAREDMRRVESEKIAIEKQRQDDCERYTGHKKENGRSAISGQQHNDGLIHPFCQRCFKQMTPYAPGKEQISNGLQPV